MNAEIHNTLSFLLRMGADKRRTVHQLLHPAVPHASIKTSLWLSASPGMICIFGNAPTQVPCSVQTFQECVSLGDGGMCLHAGTFEKAEHPVTPRGYAASLGLC